MITQPRRGLLRAAASLAVGIALTGAATTASVLAASSEAGAVSPVPPFEPIGNPPEAGGLLFFNSVGTQITTGSTTTAPFAAYVEGTSVLNTSDSKATVDVFTPVNGVSPGQWSGEGLSHSTAYPNASAPSPLNTSVLPVETGSGADTTLATYILSFPNTAPATSPYHGLYVVRLITSNPVTTTSYDEAVIKVTGTSWSVVYPTTAVAVTTTQSSPQHFGSSVTIKATLAPSTATGSVQFKVGTTNVGTPVTVATGKAQTSTTALPVGTDVLNAVFTSTGATSGAIGNTVFTVSKATTSVTLTTTPASPKPLGTTITLKATVTPSIAAGTVQFKQGTTNIGSAVMVATGKAQTSTTALPLGTDAISAVFTPTSSNYQGSTGTATFDVTKVPTTTVLTFTPTSPRFIGTPITLTATVSPAVAGSVQFKVGATDIDSPVSVTAGVAHLSTTLPLGTDHVSAVFTPTSPDDAGSTGAATFTVDPLNPTTTTLTATPASPRPFGTTITLTATVSPAVAGTVQFKDGTTDIGSPVTVSAGKASTTTSTLPVGTDHLHAVFTPSTTGYESSTGTLTFTVTAVTTTTTLTATPASPQPFGTTVTLTATVSPAVAGTVQFKDGTTDIGSPVTVHAGKASTTTATLPAGTDALHAVFTPTSPNYSPSTGNATFTITPATTTTHLTASPAGSQFVGGTVTLTATVSPAVAGTVQFKETGTDIGGPVTVNSGTAKLATASLPVGTRTLSAVFTPTSGNYSASTGTATYVIVPLTSTTTALSATPAGPVFVGASVDLRATVTPSTAVGTVQFKVGTTDIGSPVTVSAGTASLPTTTLPVGTDTLSAVFVPAADSGFSGSTGTAQITVNPLTSTTTALGTSPASPQVSGTAVTLTATVAPSGAPGTVQFKVGSADLGAPVAVSAGIASLTTSTLPVGTDDLTAVFTPTAGSGYSGSSGDAQFTVTGRTGKGYWLVASDGGIFNYGDAGFYGSAGAIDLNKPIVGMAPTPDGRGYWLVASDGGIFNYGDAGFYGSAGAIDLNKPIVGIAATPDGKGYWLVASDGGIFNYGDAGFYGSAGAIDLNKPIVGIAATPDGKGYWLVASDGGIFNYGDAGFYGSAGAIDLNKPIVGIAPTADGGGYWLVASDGGIFNYGDAAFEGSAGAIDLNKPIVGIAPTPDGGGYWLVASDGGIFNYGDATFEGSAGSLTLAKPIVGLAGA